ncbi:putative FERM domain-containing protein 1-like [Scophthalmus maximus]|uniref:Putative FERM domain-containing protein 1-like n=1 Tax=Scophthalmus maximus TaxID=52904 RepID=A0A2U9CMB0_SCOMX|nr:putative FERM domain-containing protein 1-like [Scophthalmus maximus]
MRTKKRRQLCILLPNKQHLDCTVGVKARGREVLSSVLGQLRVSDLHVFGLAVLRDNEYLFLDLDLKLSKYFGKRWNKGSTTVPFIIFLRAQFYVENGQLISSGRVRQLYYTELRQKVLRSQSRQQEALFFQLAASALQAEVGDLEQGEGNEEEEEGRRRRKHRRYFLPEDYFPTWLIKRRGRDFLLLHCPVLHGELRGVSRGRAMLQFIKEAGRLQDGPLTFYRMRREKIELRSSILLGVAVKGVHIYEEVGGKLCLLHDLSWADVDRFTFQGSRFVLAAVGSLCLPKLVYYTHSAFHSKHVLRHLSDSHRHHINTRDAVDYIQQLEDMQASHFYREAYICDTARLRQRLQSGSLTSSMSDSSVAVGTRTAWSKEEDEEEEEKEDEGSVTVAELESCVDEQEEVFVDNPAEVSWLAELIHGVSVDGPLVLPSSWTAVTTEMKQVLRTRADEGVSVD